MKKVIIVIENTADKGKTETLREVANSLQSEFLVDKIIHEMTSSKGDFSFVIQIKGKIIGIESKGDPKTNLKNRLFALSDKHNCDIIFCATRTRGETTQFVQQFKKERGFREIRTSTYEIVANNENERKLANKLKAQHLLGLLERLNLL